MHFENLDYIKKVFSSLTLLFSIHCLLPLKYIAGADLGFFKGVAGTLGLQNQWSMFPKCYNVRTFFITTSVTKKLVITIRNLTRVFAFTFSSTKRRAG